MCDGRPVLVDHLVAAQPCELHRRREPGFDVCALALEAFDQTHRVGFVVRWRRVIVEHQFDKLLLREHRREVRHRQHEVPFVHRAELLEAASPFLVDGRRDGIGKVRQAPLRVVRRRPAHGIHMHHPTAAHPGQRLVDAEGHHFALLVGAAGVVVALVKPGGHECAVLAHDHAVIHDGRVVEQVGQAGVLAPMLLELQLGIDGANARVQDQQQHRP